MLSLSFSTVGLLLTAALASGAHAKSLSQAKLDALVAQAAQKKNFANKRADNCVSLAGSWAGRCVERSGGGDGGPLNVKIGQENCNLVSIDNLPIPNHGSFSGQVSHMTQQELTNVNSAVTLTGSWNDAQTRFTSVRLVAVPMLGLNFVASEYYELDGDTLVVGDGEYGAILDESGAPSEWTLSKLDCRLSRQK